MISSELTLRIAAAAWCVEPRFVPLACDSKACRSASDSRLSYGEPRDALYQNRRPRNRREETNR